MKSRKLGMIAKRFFYGRAAAKHQRKQSLRKGLLEKLEDRNLMASDWNPALVGSTGFFKDAAGRTSTMNYVASQGMSSGGGNMSAEGGSPNTLTVSEVEPNNSFFQAQPIPLTTTTSVVVLGNNANQLDEDWVSFDLNGGDIFDARLIANAAAVTPLISLYNSSNFELISKNSTPTGNYPTSSPLTGSISAPIGNAGLSYVIPRAGKYYFRVGDVLNSYSVTFSLYRPVLEQQPVGTHQTLFLDFDGAIVPRNTVGFGPGSARFSPFSRSLPGWGLLPADEPALINEITQRVTDKFAFLQQNSASRNVQFKIVNSKDVVDPWGNPNVSRVIIGGTYQELLGDPAATNPGLIGIAESVDVGNFDTTETALVMQDVLVSGAFFVPIGGRATRIQYVAELIAGVVAHEAGHYLGGLHQEPVSAVNGIMDQFYDPFVFSGAGRDFTFGTADDERLNFVVDEYVLYGPPFTITNGNQPLPGGINDTINGVGWAISGGTVGGRINGNIYHDRNLSRTKDAGDTNLPGVRVYVDLNANDQYDGHEFSAVSDSLGNYSILVPSGSYTVRELVPSGYRLTTPQSGEINVTVTGTNTVNNVNFGQELLSLNATGLKWNDANGNGLRDPGEGIIAGVRLYLDLDGDQRIDIGEPSAKTNDQGQYTLTFPGAGTYKIREVVDPGYVQTFPTSAMNFEHTVVVTGNAAVDALALAGLNFGNKLTVDFGDAPSTFGEASAGFTAGLRLGANWDDEQTSQFSATASGDDANGRLDANDSVIDDEDGAIFTRPLVRGSSSNRVSLTAVNSTGTSAYVSAWIDFNQDGDFNDAGEKVISDTVLATGTTVLTFAAPANAVLGTTFARFRYSSQANVGPTGRALGGEVEDYQVQVVPTLDLATNDRFSVSRNSVRNSLDVLANDFSMPGETLQIVRTSGSRAGGIVQVSTTNQILYTPPAGFIGQDSFEYTMQNSAGETDTATVVVDVNLFFADPIAVDDSFDITLNSIDIPLPVLANDIEGQSGALTIIMVTQPSSGGQVSIASGGKALRYTPVRGFNGTETLTYTVADAAGNQTTARVTLHIVPYVNAITDVVYRLRTTDLNGNEISAIPQGQDFKLEVLVDDFRNDRGAATSAPGVFAAYMDLLYNLQLVSTAIPAAGSALNFDVDFFNSYVNGRNGDATVPGIIDEFGAFNSTGNNADPGSMNFPDEVRLASITFTARSPGVARFTPDPADNSPAHDTLLFDVAGSAVPVERIRFLSTSIEIVGDSDEFPLAVDDSLATAIPFGSIRYPIDVKANDLPGSTGPINVIAVTSGLNGTTSIDSQGRVLYTPNGGFTGTDQFTYTIEDARSIRSQARVTVRVGMADANDLVEMRLEVTDINGIPITDIAVGGQFQLRGYIKDLRAPGPNRGVFAAYQDVLYSSSFVNPVATSTAANPLGFQVVFGANYSRLTDGDIVNRGIINELGSVQRLDLDANGNIVGSAQPLGSGEFLQFTVTMVARSVGTATFIGDPADVIPLHDTLTFDPAEVVTFDQIRFGFDTLNIRSSGNLGGGEFTNPLDRHDVNGDGFVSPIDALIVINYLGGNRGAGEGEDSKKYFVDVNGDNNLSPIDALLVINRLNANRGASGEGEGEGSGTVLQVLSSGALAKSASTSDDSEVYGQLVEDLAPAIKSSIGARDTGVQYGPFAIASDSNATDSVFAEGESALEDLLAQLAPDIEETRKKR